MAAQAVRYAVQAMAALVELPVRVPGAPHERACAADRVAPHEGLGLAINQQQAALFETAEGDEAVEQGEGDLLQVRLEGVLAGHPCLAAGLEDREHDVSGARVVGREDPAAGGRAHSLGVNAPGRQLPAGVLLEADPELGDPGGEDRADWLGDAPGGVRGHD